MPGPPIFFESNPLADKAASLIISASSLILDCLDSSLLFGSTLIELGEIIDDWVYVLLVTISLCIFFIDQPDSMKYLLRASSSSGWLGRAPLVPKSSSVSTIPFPKYRIQILLTVTLAVNGFVSSTNHLARSNRVFIFDVSVSLALIAEMKFGFNGPVSLSGVVKSPLVSK